MRDKGTMSLVEARRYKRRHLYNGISAWLTGAVAIILIVTAYNRSSVLLPINPGSIGAIFWFGILLNIFSLLFYLVATIYALRFARVKFLFLNTLFSLIQGGLLFYFSRDILLRGDSGKYELVTPLGGRILSIIMIITGLLVLIIGLMEIGRHRQ